MSSLRVAVAHPPKLACYIVSGNQVTAILQFSQLAPALRLQFVGAACGVFPVSMQLRAMRLPALGSVGRQRLGTNTNDALLLGCLHWGSVDSVYSPDSNLSNTVKQDRHAADTGVKITAGATGNFTGSGKNSPYVSVLWAVAPGTSPINNVPTIVLDSPANAATNVSTTPTFLFTGSDVENENLSYEIQISDNPDDFVGGTILTDSFNGGGGGSFHPQPHISGMTWQGNIQVDDRMCQSFTAQGGKWVKTVLPLGDSRVDTSGTAYTRIYEHSGVFGTSSAIANAGLPNNQTTAGTPTINWLAQSNGVSLGASFVGGDFDFAASGANQIRFAPGGKYVMCGDWIPNNNLANNTWAFSGDVLNGGTLHPGNLYHDGYSPSNHGVHADWDLHFKMYESFTLEDAESASDVGYVNTDNGGDTSPFTAGDQISYSIQAGLDEGITYFWRAKVSDGTVTSDWTTSQSFTTGATSTPTPTPTATPTPTLTPTSTPTPSPTTTSSPSPTATPTPILASQISSTTTVMSSVAQACTDVQPQGTPDLFQITSNTDSSTVFFTPILGVDKYYLSYSTQESAEEHGAELSLNSSGVQNFTIEHLQPGEIYYFKVRGQNGCAVGNWSRTVSAVTTNRTGLINQALHDSFEVTETSVILPREENSTESAGGGKEEKSDTAQIHDLLLTIVLSGKPLVGAQVELHSDPQYGTTDENGQVRFANVEKGEHTLVVAHSEYKAKQKINVAGDSREQSVEITLEVKESWLPNWAWLSIIAVLATVICFLILKSIRIKQTTLHRSDEK